MDFTAANVEQAVQQFYVNTSGQPEVHQWLTKAQISPDAWTFSWDLLSADKPTEVQFFGASSVYLKISRFWSELPVEQIESLRTQLLQKILQFANGPKIVLTRLCLSLSSCLLQTVPELWPDAVQNIISMFQAQTLPHLSFSTAQMVPYRKGVVRNELDKSVTYVLQLLHSLIATPSSLELFDHTLRCFSSWVQFGVVLAEADVLVHHTFQAVRNEALFDTAIETLVHVFSNPTAERYPQSIQKYLVSVVGLADLLQVAMSEQDNEVSLGLARLVVTAAESHTNLLLSMTLCEGQSREIAISIVKLVLQCTAAPGFYPVDESYSDLSFGFWYILQDDIAASESAHSALYVQMFTPLYMSLVEVLLRKVQYPSVEEFSSWNDDEKEQHRCYRQDISDTLMYAYNLLHAPLLGNLCTLLESVINKSKGEDVRWQDVEAILLLFSAVAESVDLEEKTYLPILFSLIPKINFTNIKLIAQALSMIGCYAEWINCHPQVLLSVIPLLLQGLRNPEVAMAATMALKEVCRENQNHLRGFVDEIMSSSKEALDTNTLKPQDANRLMGCLGYVLSVLPVDRIMSYLNVLLSPHIQQLNELSASQLSAANKAQILMKIKMLCWLFGTLDVNRKEDEDIPRSPPVSRQLQPVLIILQQLQPTFQNIASNWVVDPGIIEELCEMYKRSMRTLLEDAAPVLNDTAQLIASMYQVNPHSSLLDLAKQMIQIFASETEHQAVVVMLFQSLCNKTLIIYETGIRDHPDIAEGFMSLLTQIIKKKKLVFLQEENNILGLFQAAVISIGMPENLTVKVACSFLTELMALQDTKPDISAIIVAHGDTLLQKLMLGIGGEAPRAIIDHFADVVMALIKNHTAFSHKWCQDMVNVEAFPSPKITNKDKERFVKRIFKEQVNKKRFREAIKEFSLLCRGMIGSEYANQTSKII